jgi:hypothetical protein
MAKQYKTALGKVVDFDALIIANETAVAIGNMNVNARGDELGKGGQIIKPKSEVMKDYRAMNTPVAIDDPILDTAIKNNPSLVADDVPETKPLGKKTQPTTEEK